MVVLYEKLDSKDKAPDKNCYYSTLRAQETHFAEGHIAEKNKVGYMQPEEDIKELEQVRRLVSQSINEVFR